jgi:hypothetical protein
MGTIGTATLHWRARGIVLALAAIVTLKALDWWLHAGGHAYPSPEMHEHVRRLPIGADAVSASDAAHDFDGDGIADAFNVSCFHMEPLFRRATSGMLRVRSGSDGTTLLAHALDTPMDPVEWCGDRDGNGSDDLIVSDQGERFVLACMR